MGFYLDAYASYLKSEKELSDNTLDSYLSDIRQFVDYMKSKNIYDVRHTSNAMVLSYLLFWKRKIWHLQPFIVSFLP